MDRPLWRPYLTHVRRLNVEGKMPLLGTGFQEEQQLLGRHPIYSSDKRFDVDELEPSYDGVVGDDEDYGPREPSSSWKPLVSLIARLSRLVELNYACPNQFPPSVLRALHQHHPSCRLNLHNFRFRSLHEPETDPYEIELISSPCLHSLAVRCCRNRCSSCRKGRDEVAVLQAVTIAPHLKHVNLCRAYLPGDVSYNSLYPIPCEGFLPPVKTPRVGNLTSLSFHESGLTAEEFDQWSKHTDLSKLRALGLGGVWQFIGFETMVSSSLRSLERLDITLNTWMLGDRDWDRFQQQTERFFESLNPLKTLHLHGEADAYLIIKVLQRHGSALQDLLIDAYEVIEDHALCLVFTAAEICKFGACCPVLEKLGLTIKRFKGGYQLETSSYEALGNFPSLEKLSLRLDCHSAARDLRYPDTYGEELDDFDKALYHTYIRLYQANIRSITLFNFHVRDALHNAAVDEKLGRSIWALISANQPSSRLSSLRIVPEGGGSFATFEDEHMNVGARHISQSFLISKSIRNDRSDVDVVRIGKQAGELRDKKKDDTTDDKLRKVFQKIWPPKPDSQDWRQDWSSFPLQME
jgi:hypothetical protein